MLWKLGKESLSSVPGSGAPGARLEVHALLALHQADELAGHHAALVDELVEAVLPVGARLAKVDLARLERQARAVGGHALAVALHGDLPPQEFRVWD